MIRVYDMMVDGTTKTVSRYGATFKLTNVTRADNRRIYTYQAPGMETMVVIPDFRKQWDEVNKIASKIGKGKSLTAYTQIVQMKIDKNASVADISGDDGEEKKGIFARYKDIEIELEYDGKQLILLKLFTIRDHNVFGNNILVDFQEDEE